MHQDIGRIMFYLFVGFLLVQRAAELALAERNRRWALERGGVESGRGHYPLMVGLHALFYVSLVLEFIFFSAGWNSLWPVWLALFLMAQVLRVWAIVSLGRFWNTRIIVIPGCKLVARGPYRIIRHPNYLAVAVEILVIPVLCGAYLTAALFTLLNIMLLRRRIREEERALGVPGATDPGAVPRFIPRLGGRRS